MKIDEKNLSVIRNCSHFTNVQTCILSEDGNIYRIVKKAFTQHGCNSLKSEYEGAKLFCKLVKKDISTYILDYIDNGKFCELHLDYIDGEIGNCHTGLNRNFERLTSLIEYFEIHKLNKVENFSHGDLSVSNIIFTKNSVSWIIDWENYNNFFPNYYDLIYCITEVVLFDYVKRKKKINRGTIIQYWDFYSKICDLYKIPDEIKLGPAGWLRNTVCRYIDSGNEGLHKCPFVQNDLKMIEDLDKALCV